MGCIVTIISWSNVPPPPRVLQAVLKGDQPGVDPQELVVCDKQTIFYFSLAI